MQLKTKEHYDVIEMFERTMKAISGFRGSYNKEAKELWSKGYVYTHGETNNMFLAFRHGVSFGKALERNG